jgi:hypothetical protein
LPPPPPPGPRGGFLPPSPLRLPGGGGGGAAAGDMWCVGTKVSFKKLAEKLAQKIQRTARIICVAGPVIQTVALISLFGFPSLLVRRLASYDVIHYIVLLSSNLVRFCTHKLCWLLINYSVLLILYEMSLFLFRFFWVVFVDIFQYDSIFLNFFYSF